jgi:hypothetical protein
LIETILAGLDKKLGVGKPIAEAIRIGRPIHSD